jgi:inorganic pyrophosphatase
VVETPKGSHNKLGFEPELGAFKLEGVLPESHSFPYDFGFVPSTKAADGDPLDMLLLLDAPTFSGCVVEARLIGAG